jgi:hypothetical protein
MLQFCAKIFPQRQFFLLAHIDYNKKSRHSTNSRINVDEADSKKLQESYGPCFVKLRILSSIHNIVIVISTAAELRQA